MNTFHQIWPEVITPQDAVNKIRSQQLQLTDVAANLEEQALSLVGRDIYDLLIRDYTVKQWQTDPKLLPADIIKRLPIRYTYDDNYFNDQFQGIPESGYTSLFERMLDDIDVELNVDYFKDRAYWNSQAQRVVFSGSIDEWFNYDLGVLEYRSLNFETVTMNTDNYQGNAVINNCDSNTTWTRVIEHRHFARSRSDVTVVTREIPAVWDQTQIPYYPINSQKNQQLYEKYKTLADQQNVIFGGRLAEYRYYDMHQVIGSAMKKARLELK
jgi:UDP-galactopyranose mutase